MPLGTCLLGCCKNYFFILKNWEEKKWKLFCVSVQKKIHFTFESNT